MLTKVDVTNQRGNVLTFNMIDDDSPYVAVFDGLDPVDATLSSSSYVGDDGEIFHSAKRGARNIKIKVDLDPDFVTWTYTTLRKNLYRWFSPKAPITLRFWDNTGLYVDIQGIVESCSSPQFEQDPTAAISIMCYKPDFIDPRTVTVSGHTVADMTNTVLTYPGDVEAGTVVTLSVNRPLPDFTIYNIDEGGKIDQLDFSGDLDEGDVLVVSSVRGNKGVWRTRAGVTTSYLYGRSAQSSWVYVSEGVNNFRIYAPGDPVPYVLEYSVRYGGL